MPSTFLMIFFVPKLAVGLIAAAIILARRVGLVVPFAFVATCVLSVGTFLNVAVFDMADAKFRELWMKSRLEIYWPLWRAERDLRTTSHLALAPNERQRGCGVAGCVPARFSRGN